MEHNNKIVDDWAKEAIQKLKDYGYLEKTNRPVFMIAFAIIIAGMIAGGCVLYAVNNDAWKCNITQTCPQAPACNCPIVNVPACPEIKFPNLVCNNTCIYPNNISIKLSNSS